MKGLPGWTQKQFKKEKKFLGLRVSTNDADWNKYGPFLRERKDISESGAQIHRLPWKKEVSLRRSLSTWSGHLKISSQRISLFAVSPSFPFSKQRIYCGCTVLLSHYILGERYVGHVWIKSSHTPQWREEYQPLRDPGVLNRNFELPLLNMEGVHCLLEEELAWFWWLDR